MRTKRQFGTLVIQAALVVVLIGTAGCEADGQESSDDESTAETIPFRKDGELTFLRESADSLVIDIEIADTDSARERGLMQRSPLPERSGMLFLFPREEVQSFWMANTPIALDLMFVNADTQIVDIAKYTRPFSASSIVSDAPARFVIEVAAGFSDTHGITEGESVTWRRTGQVDR